MIVKDFDFTIVERFFTAGDILFYEYKFKHVQSVREKVEIVLMEEYLKARSNKKHYGAFSSEGLTFSGGCWNAIKRKIFLAVQNNSKLLEKIRMEFRLFDKSNGELIDKSMREVELCIKEINKDILCNNLIKKKYLTPDVITKIVETKFLELSKKMEENSFYDKFVWNKFQELEDDEKVLRFEKYGKKFKKLKAAEQKEFVINGGKEKLEYILKDSYLSFLSDFEMFSFLGMLKKGEEKNEEQTRKFFSCEIVNSENFFKEGMDYDQGQVIFKMKEEGFIFQNDLYVYPEVKEKNENFQKEKFNATVATIAILTSSIYYLCDLIKNPFHFKIYLVLLGGFVIFRIIAILIKSNNNKVISNR